MPFILLGAAGVVVAATYLVPLIIACVVGAVTVIATFVVTKAYYENSSENDVEMQNLKAEQVKNDRMIRDEIERITHETGVDIQKLLKLSKEQQDEFKRSIDGFMQNIEKTDELRQSFSLIADSLQGSSTDANLQQEILNSELERMKVELSHVNQKLSETARELASKEEKLQQTIKALTDFEDKFNSSEVLSQLERIAKIDEVSRQKGDFAEQADSEKDAEILVLRARNSSMNQTIDDLTSTVNRLQLNLKDRTEIEQLQLKEIQELIGDNKRMTTTIESLTDKIAENNNRASQLTTNTVNQLRLFG